MYKKAWCTCRVVVLPIQTFFILPYSLASPSSLLKLPSSLNWDAVRSRHFQLSFPPFTWYEGDCNGTWANPSLQITASHRSNDRQILDFDGQKLGLVGHSLFLFSIFGPTRLVSWPAKPGPFPVKWPPYSQKLFAGLTLTFTHLPPVTFPVIKC